MNTEILSFFNKIKCVENDGMLVLRFDVDTSIHNFDGIKYLNFSLEEFDLFANATGDVGTFKKLTEYEVYSAVFKALNMSTSPFRSFAHIDWQFTRIYRRYYCDDVMYIGDSLKCYFEFKTLEELIAFFETSCIEELKIDLSLLDRNDILKEIGFFEEMQKPFYCINNFYKL